LGLPFGDVPVRGTSPNGISLSDELNFIAAWDTYFDNPNSITSLSEDDFTKLFAGGLGLYGGYHRRAALLFLRDSHHKILPKIPIIISRPVPLQSLLSTATSMSSSMSVNLCLILL
jgi:hypothetical protein